MSKFKINYFVIFCLSFLFGNFALASSGNSSGGQKMILWGFLLLILSVIGLFIFIFSKQLSKISDDKRSKWTKKMFNYPVLFLILVFVMYLISKEFFVGAQHGSFSNCGIKYVGDKLGVIARCVRQEYYIGFSYLISSMVLMLYGALSRYFNKNYIGYVLFCSGLVLFVYLAVLNLSPYFIKTSFYYILK